MTDKRVTVVIPCRNEVNYIKRCVDSLLSNDYEDKELIVIDGMSTDGTRDILKSYSSRYDNFRFVENPDLVTPVAMNRGIENATGRFIMIAGAHSYYAEDYISQLVKSLGELDDAAGVGGVMKTETDGSDLSISIAKVLSDKYGVGNSTFRIGADRPVEVDTLPFGLYYRTVFDKAGKYNTQLKRNQDIEWSKRVLKYAGKLYLIPDAVCTYFLRGNYRYLSRSAYNNGHWNILTVYITRTLSSLSLRHFIPLAFLFSIILPLLLSFLVTTWFAVLTPVILIVYSVFLMYRSYRLSDNGKNVWKIFLSYPILHFSYGFGSLTGLFRINKLFK